MSFASSTTSDGSDASSTTPDGPDMSAFDLPGYTLPLDFRPGYPHYGDDSLTYRNALMQENVIDLVVDRAFTNREITMLRIMNRITEVPGWETWAPDANLVSEWLDKYKVENELSPDTTQQNVTNEYLFSDAVLPEGVTNEETGQHIQHSTEIEEVTSMMKLCMISELRHRAEHFQRTKAVMVFDTCVKSDDVIPSDLREALVSAAHALEKSQIVHKNEGSESSCQVDIVDPNFFPLIYGRSKILTDRHIGLHDCIPVSGTGKTLIIRFIDRDTRSWYDVKYQQLPCDVSLSDDRCQIVSYINGVHPIHHQKLYFVIEDILTRAMPLLNEALNYHEIPLRIDLPEDIDDRADDFGFEGMFDEDPEFCKWEAAGGVELPEPHSLERQNSVFGENEGVNSLRVKFQDRGLQAIVRIECIELTPAEPEMDEEEWRLEGQPNEHICATVAYCYDARNVTGQVFNFHQRKDFTDMIENEGHYGENWMNYLMVIFSDIAESDVSENKTVTQELGPVPFPSGRLLVFPNVFQRQRSGLSLVDKSKPGYCKTLFLYFIDPHIRIISTANVPPLREDWCENRAAFIHWFLCSRLPAEIALMVETELGDEMLPPMTLAEAHEHRDLMISSREKLTERHNYLFEHDHLP